LINEVHGLGSEIARGSLIGGIFYRGWMNVKLSLTFNDRKAILDLYGVGENIAISAYKKCFERLLRVFK
jgi:hypothetical protein